MKKFIAAMLIVAMSFALSACGQNNQGDSTTAQGGADNTGTVNSKFKVAMVTDVGGINDQSFNQSAWEGLQRLKDNHSIEVSYQESQQESSFEPNLDKMVDAGNNLIWGVGFLMGDALKNAALENPDSHFAIVDFAYPEVPPNVVCAVFKGQEPSLLVGYMAGRTTKVNNVGFIGGIKGEVIDQFEFGYRAGVALAAKELGKTIDVQIQYADSFSDDAKGKAIAQSMYSNGCDIIFHAAGNVGQGVIEAARSLDKLVIGVDRDQSYLAPDNVMSSAMKLVGTAMFDISEALASGETTQLGTVVPFGLAEGAAAIPLFEGSTAKLVTKEAYDATMKIGDQIIEGKVVAPYNESTYNDFISKLQ